MISILKSATQCSSRPAQNAIRLAALRQRVHRLPTQTQLLQFHSSRVFAQIPATQTAFLFKNGQTTLEKKEIPVPKVEPGNVLLKIAAAGVCHSDLHILEGGLPYPDGLILGHEISGYIAAYGEGVDPELFPKDSVYAVVGPNPCGTCKHCRSGHDNLCIEPTRSHMGLGTPGGYEQYTQINPRNLTRVPKGVSPAIAAVTTDAVLTPYHALKRANINGLTRLLVIGLGGLGINGVQIAKAFGAHVIAVDPKESSRKLAEEYGADQVLSELPEEGLEVDVVADFVGSQSTFDLAQKHVKSAGIVMPIGLHSPHLSFDLNRFAFKEFVFMGNFWGTSQDQAECFELVAKGLVVPQIETTNYLNVNKVLQELRDGKVKSRLVLVHDE